MLQPDVTIIIAMYNAEPFLVQCLDSLCVQTWAHLQVVCVDDASTDGTLALAQAYANRDERIEVIPLPHNSGISKARNVGLRAARGRYIAFLDSDDWMSPDCMEQVVQMFRQHPQTDCVLLRTIFYYDEKRQEEFAMQGHECMSGNDAFLLSLTWKIHGVYVVRAELYRRYPNDESARTYSDENVTHLHYLASREVRLCDGVYYYRQRASSVSHAFGMQRFDSLVAKASLKQALIDCHVSQEVLDHFEHHRWLNIIDLYMLYFIHRRKLSSLDRAKALARIRHAWETIEVDRLPLRQRLKLGYAPLRGSWTLFRLQEECYFMLRRLMGHLCFKDLA